MARIANPDGSYGDGKFDIVCLSGAGTKAFVHLGVLHHYYEIGRLDLARAQDFPGTSAGSIINLLLISGYTPMEILSEVYGINNFFASGGGPTNIWDLIANYGFLSIDPPMKLVEKMVITKLGKIPTLWELYKLTGKRLISPAVNISKKPKPVLVYITPESHPNMRCTDVPKLSSKLPIIFQRVQYNGDYYEDGGLGDNFPVEAVDIRGKNVLGVAVTGSDMGGAETLPFITWLYRVIMFPINTNTDLRSRNLPPNVKLVSMNFDDVPVLELNMDHGRKMGMFMRGYKEAQREDKKEKLTIKGWNWDLSADEISPTEGLLCVADDALPSSVPVEITNAWDVEGWDVDISKTMFPEMES